jgi:hypothetical protein
VKTWLYIVICLFLLLLGLPLTQTAFRWLPEAPLAGVEKVPPVPEFRPGAWWDGSLQDRFDPWFNAKVGLRGWMVRTFNQIQYSVFGRFAGSGTKVVQGRGGVLFEKVYVDSFRSPRKRKEKDLRDVCSGVRELQDRLAARGVAFLLVIAPSKAEILPEFLPEGIDVAGRAGKRSARDDMAALLDEYGIHHLDMHEAFKAWKAEGAPALFPNGGTHWNHYAAARVAGLTLGALREQGRKPMPELRVTGSVTNGVVWGADNDLGDLLNLWTSRKFAGPQIHPVLEKTASDPLPDILFIGDSFVLTLTKVMDDEGLYRKRDTFYYFNRRFAYPGNREESLDQGNVDVAAELAGRDAVVIEINEYWLPRIGFGFVKAALKALKK